MVDITQPSILGYAITPWFIILCSCIIGTIILAISVVLGFSERASKERELIEKDSKSHVKKINVATTTTESNNAKLTGDDFAEKTEGIDPVNYNVCIDTTNRVSEIKQENIEGFNDVEATEAIVGEKTEGLTDADNTQALLDCDKTMGLGDNEQTEALGDRNIILGQIDNELTESIHTQTNELTVGLSENELTECIHEQGNEVTIGLTDGLIESMNSKDKRKSNFCSQCGNRVSGNFCSRCGHQITWH